LPSVEFTEDDLEQFEPPVREALLRLWRHQVSRKPPEDSIPQAPGLKVTDHKTADDLAKEWRDHYKGGAVHRDPQDGG
jgi:hypothetical protein